MRSSLLFVLALAVSAPVWAARPSTVQEAASAAGEVAEKAVVQGELTLAVCLALARVAHEDVIIARARVRDAEMRTDVEKAGRKPTLDVTVDSRFGNFGPRIYDPTGSGTLIQNAANVELYFNASWNILNPQRRKLIHRAHAVELQTRAASRGMLRDLDHGVALAFMDAVRAEQTEDVQRELLELDERATEIARTRERVGDGTKVDTAQAQAQLELAKQELLAAENATEKARLTLLSAMGLAEDPGLRFPAYKGPTNLKVPPLAECLDRAYDARDDIEELQYALDVAKIDVKLANLGRRISYDLTASAYSAASQGLAQPNWQIAFSARMPLFDGGRTKSELLAAEARQIISEAEVSAALRNVWLSVTTAYRDRESAREQLVAAQAAEAAAALSLEKTMASHRSGVASFFDTLEARRQYAQARLQAIAAATGIWTATWDLDRAAPGVLSELNPLSDPALLLDEPSGGGPG